jgi:hypothetical protein
MDSNLAKARSSIVWILAILVAFGAVWWIETTSGKAIADAQQGPRLDTSPDLPSLPAPRALTADETAWARTAWAYFVRNTDPATGLTGSVEGFPSGSLWDIGSSLMALVSAHELGMVPRAEFDERLARALASIAKLPLYANALPNKAYDIRQLQMTDYDNKPTPSGIGWSAIDLGRLLVPLNIVAWRYPAHTPAARAAIARWDTSRLARGGQLQGMTVQAGQAPQLVQEGRTGYEQYAARTLALMGLDVETALDVRPFLRLAEVDGVKLCADSRDPKAFGAPTFVTSDPYILMGLETGFTRSTAECAWRLYRAQEERFRRTGIPTAVAEDNVDRAPWFVYNSAWSGGRDWVAVTEKGDEAPGLRTLSVKAAFGWHALYRNEHTSRLVAAVSALQEPGRGWYAGQYEDTKQPNKSLTANTNAVVLESLAYIARGRLLQVQKESP